MPLRKQLRLQDYQSMSPILEDRLCHVATNTTSYERAAETAKLFGISTDDSQIQRLVQRMGKRAEAQVEQRVSRAFDPKGNKEMIHEAKLELRGKGAFSMVLMLDGTMLRRRGENWGLKPASAPGERVAWHELKAGLVIRIPASAALDASKPQDTAMAPGAPADPKRKGGRKRKKLPKYYVASDGGPEVIGRRLYAEALRRGLEQAKRVYVIADGAVWIWRLAEEHFPGSVGELDFYHASEHLWALARVLHDGKEEAARAWVAPLLQNLKYRGGGELLSLLEELLKTSEKKKLSAEQHESLAREATYFHNHKSRLDYPRAKRDGVPLGSGSMESACSQLQGRFKCPGQFWSRLGERYLLALDLARRNRDWGEIWAQTA